VEGRDAGREAGERRAALRARGAPVPERSGDDTPEADCADKPVLEGVDVFDANLTGERDKLVQARFRVCKGDRANETQALRIAVVVPLAGGQLCKLEGEDLSLDRRASDKPCENAAKLPRTLDFLELTRKGRRVVQTNDQSGSCGDPAGNSSSVKAAWFEAQGAALKKIFETPLLDSTTQGQGRQLIARWKVSYGASFPKDIRVQRCIEGATECEEPDLYEYARAGGKYVRK
jgi:hypothetical protein